MNDDVFQADKQIYKYPDGAGKFKFADPLVVQVLLTNAAIEVGSTSINALIDAANKADLNTASPMEVAEAGTALMNLALVSEKVFGLAPFNAETGEGSTPAFAIGVLDHFHRFMLKKKPQPEKQQTSTPVSESISATQEITAT